MGLHLTSIKLDDIVEVVIEMDLPAVTCNSGLAPVHFRLDDAVNLTFS